jgi:radical SAM superfamily enzyme YgiQ (UPF0313 family)
MRSIFLADDNFTVYRARAKELLSAIGNWNRRQTEGPVNFVTQVSIDVAKDEELLGLCADAGLNSVFIGLETPNEDSLRETKKRQNLCVDLVERVHHVIAHGIQVIGGMIVGFDADGPGIFETQYNFATRAGIPIVTLGALVAPAATPLHARMKRDGRLKDNNAEIAAVPWSTNITKHPKLSERELLDGLRWLANNLYSPQAFGERILTLIEVFGSLRPTNANAGISSRPLRGLDRDAFEMLALVRQLGDEERLMWDRVTAAARKKPITMHAVTGALVQYLQIRHMYQLGQFWEPQLASPEAAKPYFTTATPAVSLPLAGR